MIIPLCFLLQPSLFLAKRYKASLLPNSEELYWVASFYMVSALITLEAYKMAFPGFCFVWQMNLLIVSSLSNGCCILFLFELSWIFPSIFRSLMELSNSSLNNPRGRMIWRILPLSIPWGSNYQSPVQIHLVHYSPCYLSSTQFDHYFFYFFILYLLLLLLSASLARECNSNGGSVGVGN